MLEQLARGINGYTSEKEREREGGRGREGDSNL